MNETKSKGPGYGWMPVHPESPKTLTQWMDEDGQLWDKIDPDPERPEGEKRWRLLGWEEYGFSDNMEVFDGERWKDPNTEWPPAPSCRCRPKDIAELKLGEWLAARVPVEHPNQSEPVKQQGIREASFKDTLQHAEGQTDPDMAYLDWTEGYAEHFGRQPQSLSEAWDAALLWARHNPVLESGSPPPGLEHIALQKAKEQGWNEAIEAAISAIEPLRAHDVPVHLVRDQVYVDCKKVVAQLKKGGSDDRTRNNERI